MRVSYFYIWWTTSLRSYSTYIWIVNVNVDFVLHELLLSVLKIWMRHSCITSDALIMSFNFKEEYHIKVAVLKEAVRSSGCLVWPSTSVMSSFNCVCVCEREDSFTIHSRFHTRQSTQPPHPHTTRLLLHCRFISTHFYLRICIIRQREFVHPDCIFLACLVLSENNTKKKVRREGKGDRESDTDAYLMFYALYLEDETEEMRRLFVVLLHTNHIHEYFLTTRPPSFKETPLSLIAGAESLKLPVCLCV